MIMTIEQSTLNRNENPEVFFEDLKIKTLEALTTSINQAAQHTASTFSHVVNGMMEVLRSNAHELAIHRAIEQRIRDNSMTEENWSALVASLDAHRKELLENLQAMSDENKG